MTADPVSRKAIWFPTVDEAKCIGCRECFEFCSSGVYGWDEENQRPVAEQPDQCVPGCKACAKICDQEAISFPEQPIWCTCGDCASPECDEEAAT